MEFQLLSKNKATEILAEIIDEDLSLILEVSEDICFGDDNGNYQWINLGKIELKPEKDKIQDAIQYGFYEWHILDKDDINKSIKDVIHSFDSDINGDNINNIQKSFHQGFQDILRRLLLLKPTFDSDSMARMPLKRPTTIVTDTSAIHQGAFDFVAKFLSPMARIKIPAVVKMEIQNQSDNYLKSIRTENRKKARIGALNKHLLSQGGQRALLRMELMPDVEIDRGDIGSDPIRGIVTRPGSDPEDKALGLTGVVKSFADLLIVETARLHRTQVRPDHPLIILTSDQGMARMAMVEGMGVFFFQARNSPKCTGRTLTGVCSHPFTDFYIVPLTDVLWECAVSFGGARLRNIKDDSFLELWALGGPKQLPWDPSQAKDDLIWGYCNQTLSKQKESNIKAESNIDIASFAPKGYNFSPPKMINLIEYLSKHESLSKDEIYSFLSVNKPHTFRQYLKFLESGNLIEESEDQIKVNDNLRSLWDAISGLDLNKIHDLLLSIPSYYSFYSFIREAKFIDANSEQLPISKNYLYEYTVMGEITGAILAISDEHIVVTDANPSVAEFADQAFKCYNDISQKSETELILTGEWLECLALQYNIHPIRVRKLLEDSKQNGTLDFFVEGSTPDTRFPKNTMTVLELEQGKPVLKKIFLYQGNLITPGFASNRIKIVRK